MNRKDKPMVSENDDTFAIGALLRQAREAGGISLTSMAMQLNLTKGHLSGVETGRVKPSSELIKKYEQVLKLEPGELSEQEASLPSCQVAVLTTLPVEYRAVISHLQDTKEILHPSGICYAWGRFPGEHYNWGVAVAQIGMGSVSAAIETGRIINFFQPYIALFVGLAGGLKEVSVGDVVVSTKSYNYEAGKAGRDFQPRPGVSLASFELEQYARVEAHTDDWLVRLGEGRRALAPRVFLGALASGEKVLASPDSSVYRLLQSSYSDALAIDMGGYAFLETIRAYPDTRTHGLVILGIADLIDGNYGVDHTGIQQATAARHAAAFAFQVLAKVALPSEHHPTPLKGAEKYWLENTPLPQLAPKESLWNVPFARNPFFTGRETLLEQLHALLQTTQSAVSRPKAISGLGGVGKTQLALEYAYRYMQEYEAVLWASANTREALSASYVEIARVLDLLQKDEQELGVIVQAVKDWLSSKHSWLLILDNADEPEVLTSFLPPKIGGQVLVTTRAADLTDLGLGFQHTLAVEAFTDDQGALFLLHRSGLLPLDATLGQAGAEAEQRAREIACELGGLPLALDQAGAYISKTECGLAAYQQIYEKHRSQLLKERRSAGHPEPVATTWQLSFEKVEQQNPAAADLLHLSAFLAPDAIPEELLNKGAKDLGERLAPIATDPFLLNEAIESLRAYSLISRDPQTQAMTIHRLVQMVVRDRMPIKIQQRWMQRAVSAVNAAFPNVEFQEWPICERLLPHALACAVWIEQAEITTPMAARLLNQAGRYLKDRARYGEAEPLLERALSIFERTLGPEHPDTAQSLNDLALLYQHQGRYSEAEPLYERALSIFERTLGLGHPDTAQSLNDLALLYQHQGRYSEAEPLYQRALSIFEEQLGSEHPDTAQSLNDLALLYQHQGRYSEAEPLYQCALSIFERTLGPEHPDTATSLGNLATLYGAQGRHGEAETLHQRALSILEQVLGPKHPNTQAVRKNNADL